MSKELEQNENKLIAERRAKLAKIREQAFENNTNPFPNNFCRKNLADDLQKKYSHRSKEELESSNQVVSVAGRLIRNRGAFMVIQDMSGIMQLYVVKGARPFVKNLYLGDIIGVNGVLHKSGKGDLYVSMDDNYLLTKSLRPLPDKHHGLLDKEMRYRQRYVDLIVNPESRDVFKVRTKIINFIRSYLNKKNFMEVETPMLQVIPGGAAARPFVTHHNALDLDMYLRIAP